MNIDRTRLFDQRVVQRNIRAGRVTKDEYQAWLSELSDISENIKARDDGGDDDGYEPVPPKPAADSTDAAEGTEGDAFNASAVADEADPFADDTPQPAAPVHAAPVIPSNPAQAPAYGGGAPAPTQAAPVQAVPASPAPAQDAPAQDAPAQAPSADVPPSGDAG